MTRSNPAKELLAIIPRSPLRMVPITCVQETPLEVSIAGTDSSVPAKAIEGHAFELGDKGMALWQPPLPPICFKTT